jgi:ornithine decarboxylase
VAKSRAGEWFRRYAPAELGAIVGAVLAATAVDRFGSAAATAYAGAIGETIVFYGVLFVRDLSAQRAGRSPGRAVGRTVRDLVLECGPAELLDTLVARPLAMYLATQAVGSAWLGVVLGKVAADVVFYTVAIIGYEIRKSAMRSPPRARAGTMPATDPRVPPPLDRRGGLPPPYADEVPTRQACGHLTARALDRVPSRPHVEAEPGHAPVAEAGSLGGTVIGTVVPRGRPSANPDVGAFNGVMAALETRNTLRRPVCDSRRAPDLAGAWTDAEPSLAANRFTVSVRPSTSVPGDDPIASVALDDVPYATPYLMMDLDRVGRAFLRLDDALGLDAIHYAVKCNPDPRVLATLHRLGCGFEVASYPELASLMEIGVEPADVLYSNPVKPVDHIRRAHQAGCWRFAADSDEELTKLARHAPGAAVYVRLRTTGATTSAVPSEGKFGVEPRQVRELLLAAAGVGLVPHGLAFHVGSQMTAAGPWEDSITAAGAILAELAAVGLTLEMLNIGGGFPARYGVPVPDLTVYGAVIQQALRRLPYRLRVVAEPGRALVGEAGVLVATVIGTAVRGTQRWVHLDVGAFNGVMEALEAGNTLAYPLSDSRRAATRVRCHLTGPTCDSQDTIMFDVALSAGLAEGDRVYIGTAGAYTTAYASTFNGFDMPATHCVGT